MSRNFFCFLKIENNERLLTKSQSHGSNAVVSRNFLYLIKIGVITDFYKKGYPAKTLAKILSF